MTSTPTTMRAVTIREPGTPDVLEITELPVPRPEPGQILVRVTAIGVNGPDLLQRRGHYPPPKGASPLLGLEISGEVVAITEDTEWSVGDRVCALTNGGGYAEYVAVDSTHCLPLPDGVTEQDAAGLPETYLTVWSNVFYNATLPDKANFLIHGGAGGIGSTAIQLGTAFGLTVFATASADDADYIINLGAQHAIDYANDDFVAVLREAGGADVILDIIGGSYIARNIKATRHDARIIQLAFNHGSKVELDLMSVMLKRLSYTGSTLRSRPPKFKTAITQSLRETVWPKFADGTLRPVTHATLPLEKAAEAHRMMEAGAHRGKILLEP